MMSTAGQSRLFWSLCLVHSLCLLLAGPGQVDAAVAKPVVPPREIRQQQPAAAWKQLWDQARDLARRKRYVEAARRYERLLAERPKLGAPRRELVAVYQALGTPVKAIPHLELLLDADPEQPETLRLLADLLMDQGEVGRAVGLYRRLLRLQPANVTVLARLLEGLRVQGDREGAATVLERLLTLEPANRQRQLDLARLYTELGRLDKARPLWADLAADRQAGPGILLNAARVHDRLGLENLAIGYWKRLLRLRPGNHEARQRLAAFYQAKGQGEEALAYLLELARQQPDRPSLLKRIGQLYLELKQPAKALPFFERYTALRPNDRHVLRQVIEINTSLGNQAGSLAALERFLALEPHPEWQTLDQAARLYAARGRFAQALPLYRKILAMRPDDPQVQARLARAYLALGRKGDAEALWQRLASQRRLLRVLEILHRLEPADQLVALKLATMYLQQGRLSESGRLFAELARAGMDSPDFHAGRAALYERLHFDFLALDEYRSLLRSVPDHRQVRQRCLVLEGRLGLVSQLRKGLDRLPPSPAPAGTSLEEERFLAMDALRQSGAAAAALAWFEARLRQPALAAGDQARLLLASARAYQDLGLTDEAEQALRLALLAQPANREILARLCELALGAHRNEEAAVWLGQLEAATDRQGNGGTMLPAWRLELLRARLLAAEQEFGPAERILRSLLEAPAASAGQRAILEEPPTAVAKRNEARSGLIKVLLADHRPEEAAEQAAAWQGSAPGALEPLVLLAAAHRASGRSGRGQELADQALALAAQDPGRLLTLSSLALRQGDPLLAATAARRAAERLPDSLRGHLLWAKALTALGDRRQALEQYARAERLDPGNLQARMARVRLLFLAGHLEEALSLSSRLPAPPAPGSARARLLRARILWARHRWQDALKLLRSSLTPPVAAELHARSQAMGLPLPKPPAPSLWVRLHLVAPPRTPWLVRLMRPEAMADRAGPGRKLCQLAVPFYARYRWQQRFQQELLARSAVVRREYYEAARQYQALVHNYPVDDSVLYDLAGVYSHLGWLDQEATLYRKLVAHHAQLPGLDQAIQRNRLKRRPRSTLEAGYHKEEGRDGYKAIRKRWLTARQWFSPSLDNRLELDLARIRYQATDGNQQLNASRLLARYDRDLFTGVRFGLAGGVEALEDGYPDTGLLRCELSGALGDRLQGRLGYRRDILEDTMASLTRRIIQDVLDGELSLDLLPRLQVGGHYRYQDFSDDNRTQSYDFWGSYILWAEPTLLRFRYTYAYQDSNEGPQPGPPLADGFAAGDHPYWSPVNYWQKRFQLLFRHQLSDSLLKRDRPRYYQAEYTLSYDSRGYALQTVKGELFVEWNNHFMLEAGGALTSSQEYRARDLFLAVSYRW